MLKKLAIVGSRNYPDLDAVRAYVKLLPKGLIVISGGAEGVDQAAQNAAGDRAISTEVYAIVEVKDVPEKMWPLARNETIVKKCDKLIAFWDMDSRGTLHAIRLALMDGKLLKIVTPFGILRPSQIVGAAHPLLPVAVAMAKEEAPEVNTEQAKLWIRLHALERRVETMEKWVGGKGGQPEPGTTAKDPPF
ncbi:MAG: hypothetical protein KAJ01_03230 [Candidatus Hydrogenedentes bacterium]|nr:hypothetical protein [Candidatus Hydrogenedentota bacterium]